MLEDKITQDYIQAMKSREALKASALSFLRAQIKNVMIDKRVEKAADEDVITVIKKQVKQRQDSIEQFAKGGRQELADKEQAEIRVLEGYLPAAADPAAVEQAVVDAILETAATSPKDMGRVMKAAMARLAGQTVDGKTVNELVRKKLTIT